jgi:hypothetical protein
LLKPSKINRIRDFVRKNPEASLATMPVALHDFEDTEPTDSDASTSSDSEDFSLSDEDSIGDDDSENSETSAEKEARRARVLPNLIQRQQLHAGLLQQQQQHMVVEQAMAVDEKLVAAIEEMGFSVDRATIVQCLRIDGTVETAVAAIISNL